MTEMPRKTISLPPELENAVYELRKSENIANAHSLEILRVMIRRGLDAEQAEGKGDTMDKTEALLMMIQAPTLGIAIGFQIASMIYRRK